VPLDTSCPDHAVSSHCPVIC